MNIIYPKFETVVIDNDLIQENDTVIIALSGGKDSVTLTLLLVELKKTINFKLIAAYFNHRLRTDYKEEEEWVKNFCSKNSIELETGNGNVKNYIKKNKLNLENGASILRYEFFKNLLLKYKNSKIFTAHSKSDTVETFFMKLLRGSGLQGLTSISMVKNNKFIRPLLIFSKEEIKNFLQRNSIGFYFDYTNKDNSFLRNKIRNTLIPRIKEIEPTVERNINKTIEIISEDYDYISNKAKTILNKNIIMNKILPTQCFNNTHKALKRHILREYIRMIKGNLLNIGFEHLNNLLIAIETKQNISLPGINLKIKKDYIFPEKTDIDSYTYSLLSINNTNNININEIGKLISINKCHSYKKPINNKEIILREDTLHLPLIIRAPRKDDKYIKFNSKINMSVFEMIRENGLPPELRNLCPVITDKFNNIIWVYYSPIADKYRIDSNTKSDYFFSIRID